MTVTWDYDGAGTLLVHLSTSVLGHTYEVDCSDFNGGFATQAGTGGAITITCTGIGGNNAGDEFHAYVLCNAERAYLAVNVFKFGEASTTGCGFPATWSYDGDKTVTVSFDTVTADDYSIGVFYYEVATGTNGGFGFASGPGSPVSLNVTAPSNIEVGSGFYAVLQDQSTPNVSTVASRLFVQGVADSGSEGDPGSGGTETGIAAAGLTAGLVSIAFTSKTLDDPPAWQTVDAHVVSWNVDRGRQSELDEIEAGTATVTLRDATGLLDDLNTLSAYAGQLKPLKQIRIQEFDPRDGTTLYTQFTGFIEDWAYTGDPAEAQLEITVSCVDGFKRLAKSEVVPDSAGQSSFARQQVDDAQRARLADAGWPSAKTQIATGNVYVKPVIYQAGTDILTTLHDCHDAEFKGVAIAFMSKDGLYTFHGRKIRFAPDSYPDFVHTYTAADGPRQVGNDDWGKISELAWGDTEDRIINACLVTPEGIDEADIAGQLFTDPTSIDELGVCQLSFTGILCDGNVNTANTDLEECLLVATYWVDNYKTPLPQIAKLVFIGRDPDDPTESGTWDILLKVELGDLISVVNVNPGGGGFNAGQFVEHISQTAEPGNGRFTKRMLELVLSPQALYDTNPFSEDDT